MAYKFATDSAIPLRKSSKTILWLRVKFRALFLEIFWLVRFTSFMGEPLWFFEG